MPRSRKMVPICFGRVIGCGHVSGLQARPVTTDGGMEMCGPGANHRSELARAREPKRILNDRRHRRGGDRSKAGNAHQTRRRFILLSQLCDDAVEPRNRFVEVAELHHELRQRLAHLKRDGFVASFDQPGQFARASQPWGAMTPTSVK
jgi:hypothetical protein